MKRITTLCPVIVIALTAFTHVSCQERKMESGRTKAGVTEQADRLVVREPAVAGAFYPADRTELERTVERYLSEVPDQKLSGRVVGLIAPHAGYAYSGKTAAYGYKTLEGRGINRVVLLAPSHYLPFRGASILRVDGYETPLGTVKLDRKACGELLESRLYSSRPGVHAREHSLEVQLPFLQEVLGDFKLVPIVVGRVELDDYEGLASPLRKLLDKKTIIIASTDFTHYGYRFDYMPFRDNVRENIEKLDFGALKKIERLDAKGFLTYQRETGATICGRCPIGILLEALPEDARGHLLKYETSGDITGDFNNSVSYVSMVFTVGEEKEMNKEREDEYLSSDEKTRLTKLARETIKNLLGGRKLPELPKGEITPRLAGKSGVFVTLHKKGMLRGCIGYIEPVKPLWEAVRDNAVSAATRDYRFPSVQKGELDDIGIEISVLTPKRKIGSLDEFVIGKHGIILEKSGRSAVFLPQVASDQGWGVEETLTHLSMKAGLSPDAWKEGTDFYVFEAVVFHE